MTITLFNSLLSHFFQGKGVFHLVVGHSNTR